MAKRSLCLLLVLATLFSLAVPAFAEEAPEEPAVTEEPVEAPDEPAPTEEPVEVAEVPVEVTEVPEVTEAPEPVVQDEPVTVAGTASGNCGSATSTGYFGSNAVWSLKDYVLTITGKGEVLGFDSGDAKDANTAIIRSGVTSIGEKAFFYFTNMASLTLPDTLTTIGFDAFYGCWQLDNLTLPDSVTTIDSGAFAYCTSLASVTIPARVTSIGDGVFQGCEDLTEINVDKGNKYYSSVDGVLFSANRKRLVQYPGGKSGAYTVPDGVTDIWTRAFIECPQLTGVTIPASVTAIGQLAFWNCTSLTSVTIPASVASIGESAFKDCTSLKNVTILNRECDLGSLTDEYNDRRLGVPGTTVIYGYEGSTAQAYAKKFGYTFKFLSKAPDTTALAAPKLSKAENVATGVKISWEKASGAAKYRVYYKGGGKTGWTKLKDVTGTSYTWTGAKSGTKYTFTVKAYNSKGTAGGYDKTGKSVTYVAAPAVKVANTSGGIKVSWNKCAGAGAYRVFYKTSANGKWKTIGDTTKTSYTRKNAKLTGGKTYWFTVRCVKAKDSKTYVSAYDTAGVKVKFVKAPTVKVAKTASGIKISWDKCAGAGAYRVFYKTSANGKWKTIGDTTKTSYTRKNAKLTSGKTYWFTVRCVNAKNGKSYVSAYDTAGKSIKYKK